MIGKKIFLNKKFTKFIKCNKTPNFVHSSLQAKFKCFNNRLINKRYLSTNQEKPTKDNFEPIKEDKTNKEENSNKEEKRSEEEEKSNEEQDKNTVIVNQIEDVEELEKIKNLLIERNELLKKDVEDIKEKFSFKDEDLEMILSREQGSNKTLSGGAVGSLFGLIVHLAESHLLELEPITQHPYIFGIANVLVFGLIGARITEYLSLNKFITHFHTKTNLFTVVLSDFYKWSLFQEREKLPELEEFQKTIYSLKDFVVEMRDNNILSRIYISSHIALLHNSPLIHSALQGLAFDKDTFTKEAYKIIKNRDFQAVRSYRINIIIQCFLLLTLLSYFSIGREQVSFYWDILKFNFGITDVPTFKPVEQPTQQENQLIQSRKDISQYSKEN